ncbi:uncharacterized protein OCT59_013285 [Rhizophagus irregularis]|uniref:uncharacterized protein n=1 Tax=Rhizophagus irregularis TaxID=588596 RepID=UPI00332A2D85|nr:hypothetical protein OCT59_013285 [Rhizophagus irregularis]
MERLTCITIKDSQQKDLKYDLYWDGNRVDRHIRKFIDNICEAALEAAWSFNCVNKTIFQDTTHIIEEKVTWALFKKYRTQLYNVINKQQFHQTSETYKQSTTNFRDYERKEI